MYTIIGKIKSGLLKNGEKNIVNLFMKNKKSMIPEIGGISHIFSTFRDWWSLSQGLKSIKRISRIGILIMIFGIVLFFILDLLNGLVTGNVVVQKIWI